MDRLPFALMFAAALACMSTTRAHAGYAMAVPPAGWTAPTSSWPAAANLGERAAYRAAANEAWIGGRIVTQAVVNVAGEAVTMPAAMRMAANAGRFAGAFAISNPLLIVGGAALLLAWYASHNMNWDDQAKVWYQNKTGYLWTTGGVTDSTQDAACAKLNNAQFHYPYSHVGAPLANGAAGCYMGYSPTGYNNEYDIYQGAQQTTREAIPDTTTAANLMDGTVPDNVANAWPAPTGWPVELPVLNPDPNNNPQVERVPLGDPRPMTDPATGTQTWSQPVYDIKPSPLPDAPWRVDLQPKDVTTTDNSNPLTKPAVVPIPNADTNTKNKDDTQQPDLCALHPDILACQKLDTPDSPDLPTRSPDLSITPDTGWGADNASCPPPRHFAVAGQTFDIPFDMVCNFMAGIRPVILAFAWLAAAAMVVTAARRQ